MLSWCSNGQTIVNFDNFGLHIKSHKLTIVLPFLLLKTIEVDNLRWTLATVIFGNVWLDNLFFSLLLTRGQLKETEKWYEKFD